MRSGSEGEQKPHTERMTQSQVLSILGQPQKREAYGPTEFLFYASRYGAE
jgi:hypothetical protein